MKRIDAHHHFWRLDRGDYQWLTPDIKSLYRDFLPADFAPIRQKHNIVQSIVVQAAASEAETEFLLTLADQDPAIGGVVGWIDMSNPQSVASLERFAKNPKFKGIRPMLQDIADPTWIEHAPHADVIDALKRLNLKFDALVKPQQLESFVKFALKHNDLPMVLDHVGKPMIREGWPNAWAGKWMRSLIVLSQMEHVSVKISGLLTEMSAEQNQSPIGFLSPVMEFLGEMFGPSRLMWGSDWPVVTTAASYDRWVEVSDSFIAPLDKEHRTAIWHDNAAQFYRLSI